MKRFILPLLFLIIGILTYLPSFSAKLFWDDEDFVTKNQYVINFKIDKFFTAQAIEGAAKPSNYFRPIQFTIYSLLYRAFGPNNMAFHAANIVIHIFAAYAVFLFIQLLLKTFRFPDKLVTIPQLNLLFLTISDLTFSSLCLVSLIVSLVFLVHPVQTEAVSYVSGLSDPLNAFFGFTSLTFFLLAIKTVSRLSRDHQPKPKKLNVDSSNIQVDSNTHQLLFYLISIASFLLALGSKETGVIFPFLLITLTMFLPGKTHERIRRVGATIPFVFLVVCYLLYHSKIDVMNMAQAWGNHPYTNSVFVRIAQFLSLLPQYITILLFPLKLVYEHDFLVKILTTIFEPVAFLSFGAVLFIAIELFVLFRTSKHFSLILFSFVGFFIAFVPYTGLVLINGIMYEHFLYIPLVFFFLFLFLILIQITQKIPSSKPHLLNPIPYPLYPILLILFLLLISRSWVRQYTWADPTHFFVTTIKDAPNSFRVHNNLGRIYEDTKQYSLAQLEYEAVIRLNPTLPHGYHNLAHLLLEEGKIADAEQNFLKAIEVDPYFSYSYISLMELYTNTNQNQKKTDIQKRIQERFPFQQK